VSDRATRGRAGSKGSASIVALALLILMAAVTAGGAVFLQGVFAYTRRTADREHLRLSLRAEGERVARLLAQDPTPDADSPLDPAWLSLGCETGGITVTLQDVSSRLNANWATKSLFEKTTLGSLLARGVTPQQLQQRREDSGISVDISAEYGDLLDADALPRYFSGYGYANLNTTDEFALRRLYAVRTGDEAGAEVFRTRWQQAIAAKKVLKRGDLRQFLGAEYGTLFPVMNVEPTFNVHFIEPLLLTQVLSMPGMKVDKPAAAAQAILSARDGTEITGERLRSMVGAPEDSPVYQCLGVTTWFWKIGVASGPDRLEMIVARVPPGDAGAPTFLVTEERYLP
jgi:hypothetical protein